MIQLFLAYIEILGTGCAIIVVLFLVVVLAFDFYWFTS